MIVGKINVIENSRSVTRMNLHVFFLRVEEFENKHQEAVLSVADRKIPFYPVAFAGYLCSK